MGKEDAPLVGRPLQHDGIGDTRQSGVLRSYEIQIGYAAAQTPHNIAVEVLIRREA